MFDGTEVRRCRDARQMSAREVADRIGVSRPYIHLIETGQRVPNETIQKKLLSLFGIADGEAGITKGAETITQELVPEQQFQKSSDDSQATQPLPNNTVISVPMLFGMVQGSLLFIESTIREPCLLNPDCEASGTVVDHSEPASQIPRKFTLEVSQQRVRLSIQSPSSIMGWVSNLTAYSRVPDVAKQARDHAEFIWFTGYASMFDRVHLSNQILGQPGQSLVLDKTLKNYLEPPKHVSMEHLHEQPRTVTEAAWDKGAE